MLLFWFVVVSFTSLQVAHACPATSAIANLCWSFVIHWLKLEQSNKMLCARFDIQSYPTLYWGPSEVVASGSAFSKEDSGLQSVSGSAVSTAEDLLQWINKRLNKWVSAFIRPCFSLTPFKRSRNAEAILLLPKLVDYCPMSSTR